MARRRLNKKVAWIGVGALLVLVGLAVMVVTPWFQDAGKFIEDGDLAVAAGDYAAAQKAYGRALKAARDTALKVDLYFKLADTFSRTDQWPKTRACWERIVVEDPENLKARLAILESLYMQADSQTRMGFKTNAIWKEIQTHSTDLLALADRKSAANDDWAKWAPAGEGNAVSVQFPRKLGPALALLRGRAAYEQVALGTETTPKEALARSRADLDKVLQGDPACVDAYWYLAKGILKDGELQVSQGDLKAKDIAYQQALQVLNKAVAAASADPQASIYLLETQLDGARAGPEDQTKDKMWALEPQYRAMVERFGASAKAHAALARFYWMQSFYRGPVQRPAYIDKAIQAAQKANDLSGSGADHALVLAELLYRKACLLGPLSGRDQAIAAAEKALQSPQANDTSGPSTVVNRANRLSLYTFLAQAGLDQILDRSPDAMTDVNSILTRTELAVDQIQQILGSGEELEVLKWRGLLDLARGHTDSGIKRLYAVYEKMRATSHSGYVDPYLAYALGRQFMGLPEQGKAVEFIATALKGGIAFTKPGAVLDYLDLLSRLDMDSHVISQVNPYNVDVFEQLFGPSDRSRSLRVKALIGTNRISEAEQEVAKLDSRAVQTLRLRLDVLGAKIAQIESGAARQRMATEETSAPGRTPTNAMSAVIGGELQADRDRQADLVRSLAELDPNLLDESVVSAACTTLIDQGKVQQAKALVDRYLRCQPDSPVVLFYQELLAEPDPGKVPAERRVPLYEKGLARIKDPLRRAAELAVSYHRNGRRPAAIEQCLRVLDLAQGQRSSTGLEIAMVSANLALDLASEVQDWDLARTVVDKARQADIDGCAGKVFEARLAFSRSQMTEALTRINEALDRRPLFSYGYMLRSLVQGAAGKEQASLEDIREAARLNPTGPMIAKVLANTLQARNQRLGATVTEVQQAETRRALEQAIRLDPSDIGMLQVYCEQIRGAEPMKALAIYQTLQRRQPTLQGAVGLGQLATGMAVKEPDPSKRNAFFEIAGSAFEQAYAMEPNHRGVVQGYAQYYRACGQIDKADKLIEQSQDQTLLWRHFIQQGKIDQAKVVLEQAYSSNPKDQDTLKGLLMLARASGDAQAMKRYSDEAIAAEDTLGNRISQVVLFLETGLVKESQAKLEDLKARYPAEPKVALLDGWLAMRQGQVTRAVDLLTRHLLADPNEAMAWSLRGQANLLAGDPNRAIDDFKRSRAIQDGPQVRLALAQAYVTAERYDDGIVELKGLIAVSSAPAEARLILERLYQRLHLAADLVNFYSQMQKAVPQDMQWTTKAAAFELQRGDVDRAQALYVKACQYKQQIYAGQSTQAWARDSDYLAALDGYWQTLLVAAGEQGDTKKGWRPSKLQQLLQEASAYLNGPFEIWARLRIAEAQAKLGDRKASIESCRVALERAGTSDPLVGMVISRMVALVGTAEVTTLCQGQVLAGPDSLAAHLAVFHLAQSQRQYDRAVDAVDQCIRLAGTDADRLEYASQKAQVLTVAYDRTSDARYLAAALREYESLLGKMPTNTSVLNNLAYLLAETGTRLSEAALHAKAAMDQRPNSPVVLDTYGYVLYKQGRHEEALQFLSAARQFYDPSNSDVPADLCDHLGRVYEALGDRTKAKAAYQQALDQGGDQGSAQVRERIKLAIGRLSS